VNESKGAKFERDFKGHKGALDVTPRSWYSMVYDDLRKRTVGYMNRVVSDKETVLIVGVGKGDILPYVWLEQRILKIGIDINEDVLKEAKEFCDTILASASHMPMKRDSTDVVFFDLVLHHLKGQKELRPSLKEAHRVLTDNGKMIAIEPNLLNFSGLLMSIINTFHMYAWLFGGSNYEYALSIKEIRSVLSGLFSSRIAALTLLHPRFPPFVQRFILKNERFLLRKLAFFAWMLLVTAHKVEKGRFH
jgi:SAM-dependent methyltransferase